MKGGQGKDGMIGRGAIKSPRLPIYRPPEHAWNGEITYWNNLMDVWEKPYSSVLLAPF